MRTEREIQERIQQLVDEERRERSAWPVRARPRDVRYRAQTIRDARLRELYWVIGEGQ